MKNALNYDPVTAIFLTAVNLNSLKSLQRANNIDTLIWSNLSKV